MAVQAPQASAATERPPGVLLIHGYTGDSTSFESLAERFSQAGFLVEVPLLPGHGTTVEDLATRRFVDWTDFLTKALDGLRSRTRSIVLVGHSMGGTLACWIAERFEVAGVVLINPFVGPISAHDLEQLRTQLEAGETMISQTMSEAKRAQESAHGYRATPILPLLSLDEAARDVTRGLDKIVAPVLLMSSREDHVVPPSSGDIIVERVRGHVERVYLEHSYHSAMRDNDAPELEARAVAFARKVVSD